MIFLYPAGIESVNNCLQGIESEKKLTEVQYFLKKDKLFPGFPVEFWTTVCYNAHIRYGSTLMTNRDEEVGFMSR